jgi:hypothetical protein
MRLSIVKVIYLHPLRARGGSWISIGHQTTPLMETISKLSVTYFGMACMHVWLEENSYSTYRRY